MIATTDSPKSRGQSADSATEPLPTPPQTPLFHALHQPRYTRQERIRQIEGRTDRRLIAFIAGPQTSISAYDIPPFVDLLDDVDEKSNLDLMLQTPGGDLDQAERVVLLCRKKIGKDGSLRVVVPDSAKSAGTVIAIAADEIVMGYVSELGPIDPQITITTASGESMQRPARSFLDGLDEIVKTTGDKDLSPAFFPLLDKLDPALIDFCKKAEGRSKKVARELLRKYMLKDNPQKASAIANELNNVKKYLSHAAVIDADAADKMGLKVLYLRPRDDLWQAFWRLYCDMRVSIRADETLFEGRQCSLII